MRGADVVRAVRQEGKGSPGGRPFAHYTDLYRNTVERAINKLKTEAWRRDMT